MRRAWERQTQTWRKGNRNSRTGEGRNRDVGCSIIHGLIKDAQAPVLSTGFWPLHRGNSSAPILAPVADPVSGSGRGRGWEWGWGWGAGGRGPPLPSPADVHLLVHPGIFLVFFFPSLPHFCHPLSPSQSRQHTHISIWTGPPGFQKQDRFPYLLREIPQELSEVVYIKH